MSSEVNWENLSYAASCFHSELKKLRNERRLDEKNYILMARFVNFTTNFNLIAHSFSYESAVFFATIL